MDYQKGYVGLTDPDWYEYLSTHPHVDEVNFWQPHGNRAFRAILSGQPFFFKLRAPMNYPAASCEISIHDPSAAKAASPLLGETDKPAQ